MGLPAKVWEETWRKHIWMTNSQLHSVSNALAIRSLHSSVFTCGFGHEWLPRRTGNWFPNSQGTEHRLWGRDFILSSPGSLHRTASILPSTWIAEFVSAACFLILFHTHVLTFTIKKTCKHHQESEKTTLRIRENSYKMLHLISDWYPEYIKNS